ncbi:MAG: glycosyltransferase, partial [Spirochaetaceae bacterium]|nr:glycosyltransferase [Spirochaetaceae bacterium]
MIIVFVQDNYAHETDGTAVSAHRFRDELIKRGHTVRVVGVDIEGADMYSVKEFHIPLVTWVAKKNNMRFGRFDKKVVTEAFTGADLVHLFFPWHLEDKCLRLAREMGIPVSAAFHVQPENISYNMMLKLLEPLNQFLYFLFRNWLYKNVDNIHCPSVFMAGELRRHKYHARLHPISNGVSDLFKPGAAAQNAPCGQGGQSGQPPGGIINIMMIGRLAEEKRQDLIIKAVKHSKYRERIQLFFAGRGPMYRRYLRQSADLPLPPRFDFLSPDKLLEQIYQTYIYVHSSDAESEGISCIESIACGKVPVISDSKKSATSQFALDGRSLFKKGNYRDLRDKIEYWIEHPEERRLMEAEYAKLGGLYNISYSAQKMEKMFEDVIRDFRTAQLIQNDKKLRRYNRRVERGNALKELLCRAFYFVIAMPLLIVFNRCFFGLKVKNAKVARSVRKTGAVAICNHVHEMDCAMCAVALPFKRLLFVSLPSNFEITAAGFFVDVLGSIPAPASPKELQVFMYTLSKHLRKGRMALFYPEGVRQNYGEELREFQRGAFYAAVDAQVPVLPVKILFRKPDGILKFFKKKPCFTIVFGEPLYPNHLMLKKEAAADLKRRSEEAMRLLTFSTT